VCLVTLVYYGQMVGWITMPLDMEVGHIVLDGDPAPPQKSEAQPQFSARVHCDQTVAHLSYC